MRYMTLGEAFEFIRNGANIKQEKGKGGIPITRIETISDGVINLDRLGYADLYDEEKYKSYMLREDDILMSHINSTKHLGKTAIYDKSKSKIIHGMNLLCLRSKRDVLDARYAFYYFNSSYFKHQLPPITKDSVNQSSFTVSALKQLQIPLPPLETQQKIADVLDKAQTLIDKRKEQLEKLDELVQSVFNEMFGDPVTNKKGWTIKTLQEMIDDEEIIGHLDGNHGGLYPKAEEFTKTGVPYIGANTIFDGQIDFEKAKYLSHKRASQFKKGIAQNGDVLFAHNATVGPVALLRTTEAFVVLSTSLTYYRCNLQKLNNYYLMEYMKTPFFAAQYQKYMGQTTRNQVPITMQKKFSHVIPPIDIQNQFAEFVEKTEQQKALMQQSLVEMENNFNSIMQRAFRGELF